MWHNTDGAPNVNEFLLSPDAGAAISGSDSARVHLCSHQLQGLTSRAAAKHVVLARSVSADLEVVKYVESHGQCG